MPVRRWVGWRTTMHTFGTKHFCLDGVGAASSSHRVFCASPAPRGPHPLSSRSTVALHSAALSSRRGGLNAATPLALSSLASPIVLFTPRSLSRPPLHPSPHPHEESHEESLTRSTPNSHSGSRSSFPPLKTRTAARGGRRWRTGWPAGGSRGG